MPRRLSQPALTLMLAAALPVAAQTWSGGSTNSGQWTQGSNWAGGQAPGGGATTALVFTGTRRLNSVQNLGAPFALNRLSFDAAAGAFTLSGNALRFSGSGARLTQGSAQRQTLENDLEIDTTLILDGSGDLSLKGRLVGNGAQLWKTGSGQLVLAQANEAYSGLVGVEGGQITVQAERGLAHAHVALGSDLGLSFAGLAQATVGGLSGGGALDLGDTTLTLSQGNYSGRLSAVRGGLVKTGAAVLELGGGGGQLRNFELRDGAAYLGSSGLSVDSLLVQRLDSQADFQISGVETGSGAQLNVRLLQVRDTDLRYERASFMAVSGVTVVAEAHIGGGATPANGQLLVARNGRMDVGLLQLGGSTASLGRLRVAEGGDLHSTGAAVLGAAGGGVGLAEVSDPGSHWRLDGGLQVGQTGGYGELLVSNRGQVQVGGATQIVAGSLLRIRGGGQLATGALTGQGRVDLQADPAGDFALVLGGDAAGAAQNFNGSVMGPGSVHKVGLGTVGLWGVNSFTGRVLVEAGTLQMGGSKAHDYEIRAGATLELNTLASLDEGTMQNQGLLVGSVNIVSSGKAWGSGHYGNLSFALGGQFSPGNDVGETQAQFARWSRGGVLQIDFAAATGTAGTNWDLLRVGSELHMDALGASVLQLRSADAALAGFDAHQGQSWLIVDTDAGVRAFDAARIQLDLSGFAPDLQGGQFSVTERSGDLFLIFAPVPEPPVWLTLGAGLGLLCSLRRHRRS